MLDMGAKAKKKSEKRPIFDSIRKPTAPAGQKFDTEKLEEKHMPSQRKAKHKKKPVLEAEE
jgi:hypothetical protein